MLETIEALYGGVNPSVIHRARLEGLLSIAEHELALTSYDARMARWFRSEGFTAMQVSDALPRNYEEQYQAWLAQETSGSKELDGFVWSV